MLQSPFALIGSAWGFYRKQPVLNEIAFWLFFLPVAAVDAFQGVVGMASIVGAQDIEEVTISSMNGMEVAMTIPLVAVVLYFMFWGQACTLMVSKRMLSSPAGRTRTSFSAVRAQAKKYIAPLFLTEVLRTAFTFFWALLLFVPGVIYSVRTLFYDIIMIENGKVAYGRPALQKSKDIVVGRTWDILWRLVIIGISIFLPIGLIDGVIEGTLLTIDTRLDTLVLVLQDFINAFASMFFIVACVALYSDLKTLSRS